MGSDYSTTKKGIFCAAEDQLCICQGHIYYGRDFWIQKQVNGPLLCNNDWMGEDPNPGKEKFCYCDANTNLADSTLEQKTITLNQFCIEGDELDNTLNGPNAEIKFKVAAHDYYFKCAWKHGDYCVFGQNECHQIAGMPVVAEVGLSLDFGLIEHDLGGDEKLLTNVPSEQWLLETYDCYNMEIRQNYNDPWKGETCVQGKIGANLGAGATINPLDKVNIGAEVDAKGSASIKLCQDLGTDYDIIYKFKVCPYEPGKYDHIQSFSESARLCRAIYNGFIYYGKAHWGRCTFYLESSEKDNFAWSVMNDSQYQVLPAFKATKQSSNVLEEENPDLGTIKPCLAYVSQNGGQLQMPGTWVANDNLCYYVKDKLGLFTDKFDFLSAPIDQDWSLIQ